MNHPSPDTILTALDDLLARYRTTRDPVVRAAALDLLTAALRAAGDAGEDRGRNLARTEDL